MLNLVSNAIKFSFNGQKVKVICDYESLNDELSSYNITIKVIDTGIGISDQDKTNLF